MIKQLSFDNFKCLSGKEFNLGKVNIFTGYNGRGKSSVMQSILLLSQSLRKDDYTSFSSLHVNGELVSLGDFEELLSTPEKSKFGINIIISNQGEHTISFVYNSSHDDRVGKLSVCEIDGKNYFGRQELKEATSSTVKEGVLGQVPAFLFNQFWSQNVHYVSADRKGPVKFVEKKEIPDHFKVGADGSHTINIISDFYDSINPEMNVNPEDKISYDLQEAVSHWVNYIMRSGSVEVPGKKNRPEAFGENRKKDAILRLDFSIGDNSTTYSSYNVGFGYSYILSIIVTALIAKENDIVIIENPEAHLHPEAQARLTFLLAKLAARGVQLFIETHSEHIINGFRLAALKPEYKLKNDDINIFFFDHDFRMTPLRINSNGKIPEWPEGFFDQYQKELAEILTLGAKAE